MNSAFGHVQINIEPAHRDFYRELFAFLGWAVWHEDANILGMGVAGKGSFWFASAPGQQTTDYDQLGVNHLGVHVEAQADVDAVAAFLRRKNVALLFETPRHRPEFAQGEGQTYYQVMFRSPDQILLEVAYMGPRTA